MTDRELILDTVQKMPEQATLSEILNELALLATLKERLAKVERREAITLPHEEVARRLRAWTTR